jgi:hypothetical protein
MKRSFLELLEEKVLFRTSRFFFLILAITALLGICAGIVYLGSGLTPTAKEEVVKAPDPAPVTLAASDISDAIKVAREESNRSGSSSPRKSESKSDRQTSRETEALSKRDLARQKYGRWLDSLETLLPAAIYSWEPKGYYDRNYWGQGNYVTTDAGIFKRLESLTDGMSAATDISRAVGQLCTVLKAFPENDRIEPLKTFIQVYRTKLAAYNRQLTENDALYNAQLAEAEAKYAADQALKKTRRYQGALVAGSGLASVALLGIFLVLLSMQRNIRKLTHWTQEEELIAFAKAQRQHPEDA